MVIPDYKLIRSSRRTLGIEIAKDLTVLVRAPQDMPVDKINELVLKNISWIEKHLEVQRQKNEARVTYELTDNDIVRLKALAASYIPARVKYYSSLMGLKPASVKITSAHSRFGSCSAKNGLCFSYILMQYPSEAVDYVVVHELAHIKHHNHSKSFYSLVGKYLPDYKQREKLLRAPPESGDLY